jgi:hypothetical protein
MVLGFGAAKADDVASLIAKKNYSKAIELIKVQIKGQKADPRLRMQLADVLIMAGKGREAAVVLEPLADEYAREGFAAKAISVLKKIQKADPNRRDIEGKLASLIEAKQRQATVSLPGPAASMPEIGMEEIGFEPPTSGPIAVPVEPIARVAPEPEIGLDAGPEVGMEMEVAASEPPPLDLAPPAAEPPPARRDIFLEEPEEGGLEFVEDEPSESLEPIVEVEAEPVAEAELFVEPEPEPEPDPMTDAAFADEVTSLLDDLFPASTSVDEDGDAGSPSGAQIVVSPLFQDFSVDELVAVIQGLKLLTYQPKQIILREGDKGESLYMLTSGTVKAYKKNAKGKQVLLAELSEGAFFGEGSILTGKPRTATVVAWEDCELLELDRPTLDSITQTHPHVWDVLQEFAAKRGSAR